MADSTPGVREVVDVTGSYPDPGHQIVGAAVMVDDRVGEGTALTDFHHRPAFVIYVSKSAATQAVLGRSDSEYLRGGIRVIYLPPGFPDDVRGVYEDGLGAALQ